jgi:hypothetical protein
MRRLFYSAEADALPVLNVLLRGEEMTGWAGLVEAS